MAFNNVIRRVSSSKVVPLAIRMASGASKRYHHCSAVLFSVNHGGICGRNIVKRSVPLALHPYSTKAGSLIQIVDEVQKAKNQSLIQILDEEIESAEGTERIEANEIPEGFPFKIEDTPGQNTITLSREYQGETIAVEVDMPSFVTGEENEGDEDNNDENEEANSSQLPLIIRVSRKKGPTLEFSCTAYPDEISIDGLALKDPDTTEDQLPYEGPDFADLDENLQRAFLKYLEIRGVKPSTTNFLHEYMINKDSKEYLLWLERIKKFVQA